MTTCCDIERRLAYHEAGHAAVCLHYGFRFQDAWINGDLGGRVNVLNIGSLAYRGHVAAIAWAGFFAEKMFFGHADTDSLSDNDLLLIVQSATCEDDILSHRIRAETIAGYCRDSIEKIAKALMLHKRLTYNDVLGVVAA